MQLDTTTIGIAGGGSAILLALARWWKRCKPTIRIGPGRVEVRWSVDP